MSEPAFLHIAADGHRDYRPGLTLRDYFAAQALVGMGTWMPIPMSAAADLRAPSTLEARASWAYAQADAMLKARKR